MDTREFIITRELEALGQYYRNDWSDFDGRVLKDKLDTLSDWIKSGKGDFTEFSDLLKQQNEEFNS